MTSIVAFLRARLDERAQAAQELQDALTLLKRQEEDVEDYEDVFGLGGMDCGWGRVGQLHYHLDRLVAQPQVVLRDVEATRKLIELHRLQVEKAATAPFDPYTGEPRPTQYEVTCDVCGWASDDPASGCTTIRLLALANDGHPDYQDGWRP